MVAGCHQTNENQHRSGFNHEESAGVVGFIEDLKIMGKQTFKSIKQTHLVPTGDDDHIM